MFGAFYDASGSQPSGLPMAITALVATEQKWHRFDRAWRVLLRRHGLRHLHMKDFAHSKGEFASWKGDEVRRVEFVQQATNTIKRGINRGFVSFVDPQVMIEASKVTEMHGADREVYAMIGAAAAHEVSNWVATKYPGQHVTHVLEAGDTGQRRLLEYLQRHGITAVPQPKLDETSGEWFPPFQAADFVAYEVRLYANHFFRGQDRRVRRSFKYIYDQLPISYITWPLGELLAEIAADPERFPPLRKAGQE